MELDKLDHLKISCTSQQGFIFDHDLVDIFIEISNIQVIEIDVHSLTISMYLTTSWGESRLKLFTRNDEEKIFLNRNDQKLLWSPQINIATNMASQKIEGDDFFVNKVKGPVRRDFIPPTHVSKNVFLTTRVKCEMEFYAFPFDKHICTLEVKYEYFFEIYLSFY